jgi:hypothetical protein
LRSPRSGAPGIALSGSRPHEGNVGGEAETVTVICTVAERDYHFGVATLCNSLYRHGYRGHVWIGWRGPLPPWAARATDAGRWHEHVACDGLALRFVLVPGPWHLANLKPALLRRLLGELDPNAATAFYFDSDIVVRCAWRFFEDWVRHGVALIQDMWDPAMLPTHLFKRRWRAHAEALGYDCRDVAGYFNSGFIGVRRADAAFLEIWERMLASAAGVGGDMARLKLDDPNHLFYKMDQDALNAAVLAASAAIATASQEMMEIYPWGEVIAHAMHFAKPWRRRYVRDALKGFPPSRPHLAHWQNVDGPIRAYSGRALLGRRLDVGLARAIGRLHHRSLHY